VMTAENLGTLETRNLWKITTFKDSEPTGTCSMRAVNNEQRRNLDSLECAG
jgi:hypothetical protein